MSTRYAPVSYNSPFEHINYGVLDTETGDIAPVSRSEGSDLVLDFLNAGVLDKEFFYWAPADVLEALGIADVVREDTNG